MHKTFPTKSLTKRLFKVPCNPGWSMILFVKSRMYLFKLLKYYLVHLKLFLLLLQSTTLKENISNSRYWSYFTRQAAVLYNMMTEQQKNRRLKVLLLNLNSKKAVLLTAFVTRKEQQLYNGLVHGIE